MKKIPVAIFFLIVAGAAAYTQRTSIKEAISDWQKPDVEEVAYSAIAPETDDTIPVEVEPTDEPDLVVAPVTESEDQPVAVPATEDPTMIEPEETTPPTTSNTTLPAEFNLAVPFTSQAPKSIWDEVHEETCEEASSLMAAYYYDGASGKIDPDTAEAALLKIVAFENSYFGYYKDTTASQTANLIEAYFHLTSDVLQDPTVDDIKTALVAGHPVIVPAAGRQLGNPNFTGEGPLYHMFVVKGYTKTGFIVNDPGTRLGADYFYTFDVVMNAMHDWNDGDVANGAKVIIVVKP